MKKCLKRITITTLITYVLVEVTCAIFIYSGYIQSDKPSFVFPSFSEMKYPPTVDTTLPWGTWHIPNVSTHYFRQAFDVHYKINSFGMRDRERKMEADSNRIVWIGDSFMEGYGVEAEDRASDLIEKATGREVLNFGCSGNFGTTQERLLYEGLASKFTHNTIVWGILPANDFHEDNPANANTRFKRRYRPYLEGTYPGYRIAYHEDSVSGSDRSLKNYAKYMGSFKAKLVAFFKSFTYWMNVYEYVKTSFTAEESGYSLENIEKEDLDRMVYNIEKVASMDSQKHMILLIIPTIYELKEQLKVNGRKNELAAILTARLEGKNVQVCDLSEKTFWKIYNVAEEPYEKGIGMIEGMFIDRDGHWTVGGNKFYARIIAEQLSRK